MTEPTNADRAAHAARALEAFLAADGREQLSGAGAMAALITGLVHYADRQGIEFGLVLAASSNSYIAQRGSEEHPYHLGQEVQIRDAAALSPSLASLPSRGVVVALYAGGMGPQMYAVRFPGEVNAMPFTGPEIEPAPPFQPVRTRQETVRSLTEAEDVLVSTAARIRLQALRKQRVAASDIKDQHLLATVLGELCNLTPEVMLRQVEVKVMAKVYGNHSGSSTPTVSAPVLVRRDFPQHPGEFRSDPPTVTGKAGSSPRTNGRRANSRRGLSEES